MKTEQEILALSNPYESYSYCLNNKETANIKAHEKMIIDSKVLYYYLLFAMNIPGADIKTFEKLIIESKNPEICYKFAKNIKNSNKQLLSEIVLASSSFYFIELFYKNIDFDKEKYKTLMMFL